MKGVSFCFVNFSLFIETFHMDYIEKKRDFCSQLLDFLEQQAKTQQSSFLLSRFMRCPLEPLDQLFHSPLSYEKKCDTMQEWYVWS